MAKDIFHETVKTALQNDGWIITADPLRLTWDDDDFEPDLAAEKIIIATKEKETIAVEIKSFVGQSFRSEFYSAVGQYVNYKLALLELEPDRQLILAVPLNTYEKYFDKTYVKAVIKAHNILLFIYEFGNKNVVKWIK